MAWTRDKLLDLISSLRTYSSASGAAPHKPLLLLLAFARLQNRRPRWYPYAEAKDELGDLLAVHNPTGNRSPEHPFWRLRNDQDEQLGGLWVLQGAASLQAAMDAGAAGRSDRQLLDGEARGGFPLELQEFLEAHPGVVNDAVELVLDLHFGRSYHEELLDAVGMPFVHEHDRDEVGPTRRAPGFRKQVLQAYNYACAFCGYDGRVGQVSLGIEAAHIRWHSRGGPDSVDNGMALCSFHHKAFDTRGVLGISDDLRILVSAAVNWRAGIGAPLLDLDGQELRIPRNTSSQPDRVFIRWHRKHLFGRP